MLLGPKLKLCCDETSARLARFSPVRRCEPKSDRKQTPKIRFRVAETLCVGWAGKSPTCEPTLEERKLGQRRRHLGGLAQSCADAATKEESVRKAQLLQRAAALWRGMRRCGWADSARGKRRPAAHAEHTARRL